MNNDNYKSAMSGVRHSAELTERIMNMTTDNTKTRIKMKPLLVIAACIALLVTGIFGGSAISARINAPANTFGITAYANDGKEVNLKDDPVVKTDVHLHYKLVDGKIPAVSESSTGFRIDGKNIKSITYSAEHGDFSYTTGNSSNVKVEHSDNPKTPYATSMKLSINNDESAVVFYKPAEAVDMILTADQNTVGLNLLINDTITVTIEYKDGTTAKATINTSFDNDGNMLLEYQE